MADINIKVILHGQQATIKGYCKKNGENCAVVWQGGSQYVVPLKDVRYSR